MEFFLTSLKILIKEKSKRRIGHVVFIIQILQGVASWPLSHIHSGLPPQYHPIKLLSADAHTKPYMDQLGSFSL